eukprot:GHVU01190574.1.p3 GENE.GHVU01190574.1~~GHVU01190574.1.p3  ORF type:complete len:109 (+),score=5.41 GHVU01190574.1:258-584(+)
MNSISYSINQYQKYLNKPPHIRLCSVPPSLDKERRIDGRRETDSKVSSCETTSIRRECGSDGGAASASEGAADAPAADPQLSPSTVLPSLHRFVAYQQKNNARGQPHR